MEENKKKYAYWMKPSMVAEIEASLDLANVKSKCRKIYQCRKCRKRQRKRSWRRHFLRKRFP